MAAVIADDGPSKYATQSDDFTIVAPRFSANNRGAVANVGKMIGPGPVRCRQEGAVVSFVVLLQIRGSLTQSDESVVGGEVSALRPVRIGLSTLRSAGTEPSDVGEL